VKARFFYIFWTIFGLSILCLLYGFFIEPRRLVLREVEVESPSYKGDPLKIAFLADIHIGGAPITSDYVQRLVGRVNAHSPDLILLGGDYINGHLPRSEHAKAFNSEIETALKHLGSLSAKQGVFAVIGNHDNWYDITFKFWIIPL